MVYLENNISAKLVDFWLLIPMLPLIFAGKFGKCWRISQIIVNMLMVFSVDFLKKIGGFSTFHAPNTDR